MILRMRWALIMMFFAALVPVPAKSQSAPEKTAHPAEELQSLTNALSGKWSVKVKFEPTSKMPNGSVGDAEETWRAGPGGFTLLEEQRTPAAAGDVFLLGVIWWDGKTKSLRGMECNNQLPFTCDLKGALNDITLTWDGKQFTVDEWETHDGKKTLWHEVWSEITPTSFTHTGDVKEPDGATKRVFTMQATRVGTSSR